MPFFEVIKGHDAWKNYATVVEADTMKEAEEIAGSGLYEGEWVETGTVYEFDDYQIHEDEGREIEAATFEEAVAEIHGDYDFTDVQLSPAERDLILAALQLWQDSVNDGSEYLNDDLIGIATNNEAHELLDDHAIQQLRERINA